jgi:16S rRNA (guanine966-N2)-methyltransferase
MRITSGDFRGRILKSPEGLATRPTSDRARQAVFNILLHAGFGGADLLDGAAVMDIFAGTGALGLEALSRGAAHAVFIEDARPALQALRANLAACRCEGRAHVVAGSALQPPPKPAALAARQVVFCDPPYNTDAAGADLGRHAVNALAAQGWLAPGALLIMEMAKKFPEGLPGKCTQLDERGYGVALVRFLRFGG